ncbi:MAG: exonuclease SbcCD subunit D [Candidatus Coproplasma sp.]
MKFFHLADLHLGKRYNELPLIDDQRYILNSILSYADEEKPQAVLIAGDVYDKNIPSTDAVELFDWFLNELTNRGILSFVISGNHDSPERLSFGSRLLNGIGVHISPVFGGSVAPVKLNDGYGEVNVYLLPFIKPVAVRRFFGEDSCKNYTEALSTVIGNMQIDNSVRNVLVAHQFVTGSVSSGSEERVVGDVGNVDYEVFAPFDYVALGHIHKAQSIGRETVRYSGTPLKYSLSEKDDNKTLTVVELKDKGEVNLRTLPLTPLRDVSEIRGEYLTVTSKPFYENAKFKNDLLHVVLTDEEEVPDALGKLRLIYPFVMSLKYDNARTRSSAEAIELCATEEKTPIELFAELYEKQNNSPLSEEQRKIVEGVIDKIWGDGQ